MQNAKDTFYEVLRGRLLALNPERTVTVRGVTRPGVLVDENELQVTAALPDCFHLRWTTATVDVQGAMPVAVMGCEIGYSTAGLGLSGTLNGGLDRGRALAAMDAELVGILDQWPMNALKTDYSELGSGGAPKSMATRVWWSDAVLGAVRADRDRMGRTVTVAVVSYLEAGE